MHQGPERRLHRLYVTRNTEYHVRGDVCVAVRDRQTGRWSDRHLAIGRRLAGGLNLDTDPSTGASPRPGDRVCFSDGTMAGTILTSALLQVVRPPREALACYRA